MRTRTKKTRTRMKMRRVSGLSQCVGISDFNALRRRFYSEARKSRLGLQGSAYMICDRSTRSKSQTATDSWMLKPRWTMRTRKTWTRKMTLWMVCTLLNRNLKR